MKVEIQDARELHKKEFQEFCISQSWNGVCDRLTASQACQFWKEATAFSHKAQSTMRATRKRRTLIPGRKLVSSQRKQFQVHDLSYTSAATIFQKYLQRFLESVNPGECKDVGEYKVSNTKETLAAMHFPSTFILEIKEKLERRVQVEVVEPAASGECDSGVKIIESTHHNFPLSLFDPVLRSLGNWIQTVLYAKFCRTKTTFRAFLEPPEESLALRASQPDLPSSIKSHSPVIYQSELIV